MKHLTYINIHRALLHTAAAAYTGHTPVVLVHKVLELVHEALSESLQLLGAGIMTRAMQGEKREHTTIPVAQPDAVALVNLVLDVEAPAGGANKSADATVDAGKMQLIPKVTVEECFDVMSLQVFSGNGRVDRAQGGFL